MNAIEGSSFCAPSFADDMSLLSLSSKSLQDMINMCHQYSCVFQYNATKGAIVTFNEFKRAFAGRSRSWFVGNEEIQEKDEFVHLGNLCNKYSSSTSIIKHVDRNSV